MMIKHKTISTLSIAAIGLLTMAVPSFAQAPSRSPDTQAGDQAILCNSELITSNKRPVATPAPSEVDRTPVKNVRQSPNPLMLSASSFKAHNDFASGRSSRFVSPKPIYAAGPNYTGRKQFRSDDYDSSSRGGKLFTFVPSRGQKLPK